MDHVLEIGNCNISLLPVYHRRVQGSSETARHAQEGKAVICIVACPRTQRTEGYRTDKQGLRSDQE